MNPTTLQTDDPSDLIDGPNAWLRLAISLLLATIGGVGTWAVIVVLPAVQSEFEVDRADASFPFTLVMLGFGAGNFFVGYAIDRWGYWRPALVATAALAGGMGLASASTSIAQFAAAHAIIGLGTSVIFGPLIADISHWFQKRRGLAVSIAAGGNYLSGALWPLIIPPLMGEANWRFAYAVIGAVCLVTMVPLILMLRRPAPVHAVGSAAAMRGVKPIQLSPSALQILLIIAGLSCCAAMSMPQVHLLTYCIDLGYGMARASEMMSIMLAAGVVSRLASGLLADRIGGIRTQLLGSVLQCLALFLYLPFDGLAALYVVSLIFGLSQGGIVPAYAMIVREYMPPAEAGRRVGLVMMSTTFGMALGGWMSGWIYDLTGSYAAAFMNGIAWNLLNLFVMAIVLWRATGLVAGGRRSPA